MTPSIDEGLVSVKKLLRTRVDCVLDLIEGQSGDINLILSDLLVE